MYHKFTGHYYRPMVMAFITGFPYLFGSSDAGIFQWSLWVNIFCWLGTSILLFEIAKHFVKEKYAFVFAILPFFLNEADIHLMLSKVTVPQSCVLALNRQLTARGKMTPVTARSVLGSD